MSKVIMGMTMSLDGFISDRNGDIGILYSDMDTLRESEGLQEMIRTTGAVVMGRHAYDMAEGDFTGYEFQTPIFVLTHHPPATPAKGENEHLRFTFVTEGIERAIALAKAAAGDQNVVVIGGASTAQQCLKAGLVDELEVDIMPVILGGGLRFLDQISEPITLERIKVDEMSGGRTEITFRVIR
ncbi:MAG: dihydrofolate reductase [Chloroflexi bacterium]|nr:dihydrofolate reductase [Chloroflexota bacterium]